MADLCVYCGNPAQLDHYQHRACAPCWERLEERCYVHKTPFVVDDDGATFCEACYFAEYLASGQTPEGYEIVRTDAPRAYDGFGTLHLGEQGRFRTVAVRCEHRAWQVERYQSGMYAVEGKLMADEAREILLLQWRLAICERRFAQARLRLGEVGPEAVAAARRHETETANRAIGGRK